VVIEAVTWADALWSSGHVLGKIRTMSDDQRSAEPAGGPAGEPDVTVDVEHHGDDVVLHVQGELDLHTTPTLTGAVEAAMRAEPSVMVIDLSGVGFIASRGLEALIVAHQSAGETLVRVVATSRATVRPLEVTGLRASLNVYDSLTAALAADGTVDSPETENP